MMKKIEAKYEGVHKRNVMIARMEVQAIMDASIDKIGKELYKYDLKSASALDWSKHKKTVGAMLTKELGTCTTKTSALLRDAMITQWNFANRKNDDLVNAYLQSIGYKDAKPKNYFNKNVKALESYVNRTVKGMKLSTTVWNLYNQDMKDQLMTYVGAGIGSGDSAASISRDIRSMLTNPESRFRRVMKNGTLVLSKRAKEFHPGSGVYRSAYKNALRLTATETNMAYRMSDWERRQQLDFCRGYEVHLSNSHGKPDICDHMKGTYPTGFKFVGWHPWCLCFTTTILMSGSEFNRWQNSGIEPKRMVNDIPNSASDYFKDNRKSLGKLKSTPYWMADNKNFLK